MAVAIHQSSPVAHLSLVLGVVRKLNVAALIDGSERNGIKLSYNPFSIKLSLSRLNHRLPGCEAHPEVVQSTAQFHHEITDALLPQANPVFDDATALHTAVDVLDP